MAVRTKSRIFLIFLDFFRPYPIFWRMENRPSIPVRVAEIDDPAPGMRILRMETEDGAPFAFQAGQYVWLEAEGQETRAFSIASSPGASCVELHVRDAGHGISAYLMTLEKGAKLRLKGPEGTNVLREGAGPLLVLAGGIGIAPMKAIVEARIASGDTSPLYLYWGVRDASQLYLDGLFRTLADSHAHFRYVPMAQDTQGYIGDALVRDFSDLSGYSVYLAGPKPMIDATTPLLLEKGAAREHIFSDAFSA